MLRARVPSVGVPPPLLPPLPSCDLIFLRRGICVGLIWLSYSRVNLSDLPFLLDGVGSFSCDRSAFFIGETTMLPLVFASMGASA